jgi:hypothetical protein
MKKHGRRDWGWSEKAASSFQLLAFSLQAMRRHSSRQHAGAVPIRARQSNHHQKEESERKYRDSLGNGFGQVTSERFGGSGTAGENPAARVVQFAAKYVF